MAAVDSATPSGPGRVSALELSSDLVFVFTITRVALIVEPAWIRPAGRRGGGVPGGARGFPGKIAIREPAAPSRRGRRGDRDHPRRHVVGAAPQLLTTAVVVAVLLVTERVLTARDAVRLTDLAGWRL